jgi:hypothetical protein
MVATRRARSSASGAGIEAVLQRCRGCSGLAAAAEHMVAAEGRLKGRQACSGRPSQDAGQGSPF